jgi:hypothetical protein
LPDIVNVSAAEQAQIQNAINRMIARLPTEITDEDLRDCIRRKAQGRGRVINQSEAAAGHQTDLGFSEWRVIGPFVVWKSDDIHISLLNHAALPPAELENTLMHEWAHTCCWDHGDGKGVPA